MENQIRKKVLVLGVIGADVHAVGNKILYHAFTQAGFEVVNLGVMVSQEEFIAAAIESAAVRGSILPAQTTGISTNCLICSTSARLQFSGI